LSERRQNELINMVKHDCGSCHGLTLKGGLGPPLTSEALINKPHVLLYNTIMTGRENTAMPPWEGMLTQQEIDWLVGLLKRGVDDKNREAINE
jgi:cytochrome c55X